MHTYDEPLLGHGFGAIPERGEETPALPDRIRRLMNEQPFGVLCTQGQGQPYGSLVAFAVREDLTGAVFATPVTTRKYRLLSGCDHVALVVDSRPNHPDSMMEIEAVTATGRAVEQERGASFDKWAALLTDRHPNLKAFVTAASCALFRIDILRYFHVVRFQEVRQWVPTASG